MMEPYGIVAMLIASLMILVTLWEYLRKKVSLRTFTGWSVIWSTIFFTGLYPEFYRGVAAAMGMSTPIHFVTTFSILALFAIVYQLYRRVVEMNRKLVKNVQHIALSRSNEK